MYTTQAQVRKAFWIGFPQHIRKPGKGQNDYRCVVREEWCAFVGMLERDGHISESLANRVTLK